MESRRNQNQLLTKPAKRTFFDPNERARLLRQYAGIFPKNIKEFGEKVIKKIKKQTNHAR